jgi:PAS domain-containing protein
MNVKEVSVLQRFLSARFTHRRLLIAVSVGLLYWAGAQIGFMFSNKGILTPVWPSAAVGATASVLFGARSLVLAVIYVAADFIDWDVSRLFKANWAFVEPLGVFLAGIAASKLAQLRVFDPRIRTLRDVGTMFLIAALYSATSGITITSVYCYIADAPHCSNVGPMSYFGEAFIGDFFGAIICMPALLGWFRYVSSDHPVVSPGMQRHDLLKLSLEHWRFILAGSLLAVLAWLATRRFGIPVDVIGYIDMPLLIWAALRFRSLFVYTTIMITGLVAITLELSSSSIVFADPLRQLASMLLFLLSVSGMTMIVHVVALQQKELAGKQATQREMERIDLMLKSAKEAVVSFNSDGGVTYFNPAAGRLFGSIELGESIQRLLPGSGIADATSRSTPPRRPEEEMLQLPDSIETQTTDGEGIERSLEVSVARYASQGDWQSPPSSTTLRIASRRRTKFALHWPNNRNSISCAASSWR